MLAKDYISPYKDLLESNGMVCSLTYRLRILALEVFKSLQKSNPPCLHDLFTLNNTFYNLRNPIPLIQPKRHTTRYGICTFSHVGANIWNSLPIITDGCLNWSVPEFKAQLNSWNGPDASCSECKYV